MLVKINLEEILEFLRDGKDCKVEIDSNGWSAVIPDDAAGYEDTILVQHFEAYDYEECEDEEDYIGWLKSSFADEIEAKNGELIKIELEK